MSWFDQALDAVGDVFDLASKGANAYLDFDAKKDGDEITNLVPDVVGTANAASPTISGIPEFNMNNILLVGMAGLAIYLLVRR